MKLTENKSFAERYLIPSKKDSRSEFIRKVVTLCIIGAIIIGIIVCVVYFTSKPASQPDVDLPDVTGTESSSPSSQDVTTEPEPEPVDPIANLVWEETPLEKEKTLKVASAASVREKPAAGAASIDTLKKGDEVKVTATTDTGYYKLSDGRFISVNLLEDINIPTNEGATAPSGKGDEPPPPAVPTQTSLEKAQAAGIREEFADVYAKNRQLKGQLTVPGTGRTYYVAQSADNYGYLNKNFFGARSVWGNPYLDFRVALNKDQRSTNVVMYAHSNDSTGDQFSGFKGYKDVNFYKSNPTIKFRSAYDDGGSDYYKVVAFFKEDTRPGTSFFQYHSFINSTGDAAFNKYIQTARDKSYWTNDVDVQPSDQLVTFSTCFDTNTNNYNRLVTIARRVRDGEDTSVDTTNATQIRDVDLNAKGK